MMIDIKNFYLNTPLDRYEYLRLKLNELPDDVMEEYGLKDKATPGGFVFVEVRKGIYGLPQAGILAQKLLKERLRAHGYHQSKIIPGFWTHDILPISFTLAADDFRVKYVGKENVEHLINVLK
jgi:hypothetical protein